MTSHHDNCNLCGDRHARRREGRLGRYSVTCDDCEARKGSHLVKTSVGYASRKVVRPPVVLVG